MSALTTHNLLDSDIQQLINEISRKHNIPEKWLTEDIQELASDSLSQWFLLRKIDDALAIGYPYAYLVGKVQFLDLTLRIKEGVFIPRPETEQLVELAIQKIKQYKDVPVVADFCAGSGAIGLAIKKHVPESDVWLVERNPTACLIIKENARRLNIKVNLICESCFYNKAKSLLKHNVTFVISNPPYVLPKELNQVDRSVIQYEPKEAWLAPPSDPLYYYREIISQYGNPQKVLLLFEGSPAIYEDVLRLLNEAGYERTSVIKDFSGKERFILGEPSSTDE
ncbi:MAG: HemK family protein methyltransferase [Chlorobi bacterium]|nr:HemK family protein methyltransferase [Chlorobiota bacterium]